MGVGYREGMAPYNHPPHWRGVWRGSSAPSPENFLFFFTSNWRILVYSNAINLKFFVKQKL